MIRRLLSLFVVYFLTLNSSQAVTYYSRTSGNWNVASTWSTVSCGGVAAAGFPGAADIVYICNGHTISVVANGNVNSVIIQSGGTLRTGTSGGGANRTLTISGNFNILNGGMYIHNNNQLASSTIFNGTEYFEANSTIRVDSWSGTGNNLITGCNSNFGHVILNWNPGLFYWNNNGLGYTRTVDGSLTVSNGCATYLDNTAGDKTISIGTLNITNGYLRIKQSNTGNITVNIPGSIIISGATSYLYGVYAVNADITFNATNITHNSGYFYGIYNGDGDITFNVSSVWFQQNGDFRGIYNTATLTAGIPTVNVNSLSFTGGIHIVNYSCNSVPQTLNYNCTTSLVISFNVASSIFAFNRLALLGATAPATSLNLHVGSGFSISGPNIGEFNSNNGTGNEVIDIDGPVTISGGSNYFNVVPNNLSNGHAVLMTIGGNVNVSGGTTVLSSESGQLDVQLAGMMSISSGMLSLKASTGKGVATINGNVNITGGNFYFNQSATIASSDSVIVTSLGDFTQTGGIINFCNNASSTGESVWYLKGANYSLSGSGGMARVGSGVSTTFGKLYFARNGIISSMRNGSPLIQQVKQVVASGCRLNLITGGLQIAAHNAPYLDMLTVQPNAILDAAGLSVFSNAQYPNTGVTVMNGGRYRLSNPNGFYNGAMNASLNATGNMDFDLGANSTVEYYGTANMVLSGMNVGTATLNRHKYGILEINHGGIGIGTMVYPTNIPNPTNGVFVRTQLVLTAGRLNLSPSSVSPLNDGRTITVENGSPSAITVGTGVLISDVQDHSGKLNWNIGTTTGVHSVPFCTHGLSNINVTYTLQSGDAGMVTFSTYPSDANAQPWPPAVTNLNSLIGLTPDNRDATVKRFWKIASSASPVADLILRYQVTELPLIPYSSPAQLRAQHYDFSVNRWMPALPLQSSGAYFVVVPGASTQTDWAVANLNAPLPVAWLSIKAMDEEGRTNVQWVTAYEKDNDHFEVQRSSDRQLVENIGAIPGKGNSQMPQSYNFYDVSPLKGTCYYRIKQVDMNGTFSYSDWVAVSRKSKHNAAFAFWPNPATDILQADGVEDGDLLAVYDASGRLLMSEELTKEKHQLSVVDLSPGVYLVEVYRGKERIYAERIMKK